MPASSTDVRQWAREQGHDVPARGAVPQHLRDAYDQAHPAGPVIPGEITDSVYDPATGVTEADFPPGDAEYDESAAGETTRPVKTVRGERRPRAVKPAKPSGVRERIFGGKRQAGRPKTRQARQSLSDFAEETWQDLAWLTEPVPPLSRILTIQAPYAGVMFDDAVKGTPVDSLLQPVARYSGSFRALNGLVGPPVYVAAICAVGTRVQVGVTEDGEPVTDYDGRTKMLFAGLRYSLLQMTKLGEVRAEEIRERTQSMHERMRAVEAMVEAIFSMPAAGEAWSAQADAAPAGAGHHNGYRYPGAPGMDGTGADPGRV